MALSKFMGFAEVLCNINACREFISWTTSGIIKAIHYRRQNNPQLPEEANRTIQHQIEDEIKRLMDGLWKLKTTMPKMLDLIDRVEWQSHKKHAADLLPDIKDAVYDAEDPFDEFDYYALKLKIESSKNSGQDNLSDTFLEFNKFRPDAIREANRIQAKLDHVHRQSRHMHLDQEPQKFDKSVRPETCSFIDEPKIFGREEELKQLVKTLIVPARKRGRDDSISAMVKLNVLPIVGMGGVGKTTIAQQICNDANVKRHFSKNIIWTCVSDDFDIKRLTKEILQHSGEGTSSDNLDTLLKKLEDFVKFKRFLIVLDDMWDDILKQDGAGWRRFLKPLENGAEGSRILVTTRSSEVANLVGTMDHYELDGLKDEVFWDFFKLCAFGSTSSHNNQESLECIGNSIVPKLKGCPLALWIIIDCCCGVIEKFPCGLFLVISLQKFKLWNFTYNREQSDKLCLEWSNVSYVTTPTREAELMFNEMEALTYFNLQHLHVRGYGGVSFPSWLRADLLPRLRSLEFDSCRRIMSIPFLGNAVGSDNHPHNSLEELIIRSCHQIYWKRLVVLPTSLRKLILSDSGYFMDNLVNRFCNLTSLTYLQIDKSLWLTVIPLDVWSSNLPSLEKLHISFCHGLTSIGVSGANSSSNCVKGSLSVDNLPVVKTIHIESCALTSLSVDRLDGLQKLSILGCPTLRVMTFPSTLKELLLLRCREIESINLGSSQLGSSLALEKLTISSRSVLRSIGGATTLAKIKNVEIGDCPELKGIRRPLIRRYVQR